MLLLHNWLGCAAGGERRTHSVPLSLLSVCVCEWNCARHRPIFPWEIEKLPQKEEKGGRERLLSVMVKIDWSQ
jgi:hypothetical protein